MRETSVFGAAERPEIEVLIDGTWYPGELRAWIPAEEGAWNGNVSYSTGVGQTYLATVPEDRIQGCEPGHLKVVAARHPLGRGRFAVCTVARMGSRSLCDNTPYPQTMIPCSHPVCALTPETRGARGWLSPASVVLVCR